MLAATIRGTTYTCAHASVPRRGARITRRRTVDIGCASAVVTMRARAVVLRGVTAGDGRSELWQRRRYWAAVTPSALTAPHARPCGSRYHAHAGA